MTLDFQKGVSSSTQRHLSTKEWVLLALVFGFLTVMVVATWMPGRWATTHPDLRGARSEQEGVGGVDSRYSSFSEPSGKSLRKSSSGSSYGFSGDSSCEATDESASGLGRASRSRCTTMEKKELVVLMD